MSASEVCSNWLKGTIFIMEIWCTVRVKRKQMHHLSEMHIMLRTKKNGLVFSGINNYNNSKLEEVKKWMKICWDELVKGTGFISKPLPRGVRLRSACLSTTRRLSCAGSPDCGTHSFKVSRLRLMMRGCTSVLPPPPPTTDNRRQPPPRGGNFRK